MLRKFCSIALAAGLTLSIAAPGTLAAEFNQSQRDEIGSIVREYLLDNPEVLRDAFQELERRQRQAEADQAKQTIIDNKAAIFHAERDLVMGNPEGSVTMVEFFDYNCGYCKRAMPDVAKLIETDKDLKVVFKEFPILGPGSLVAARASIASQKQGKNWEFHEAMLAHKGAIKEEQVYAIAGKIGLDVDQLKRDMEDPAIDETLRANIKIAEALGIKGTPAFLIDDQLIPGAVGYRTLAQTIASQRKDGGCVAC